MKTSDLIDHASEAALEKGAAKKAVEAVFVAIVEAAKKGEEANFPGFGNFKVKDSPARQGRNPATGETIEIAASRKLAARLQAATSSGLPVLLRTSATAGHGMGTSLNEHIAQDTDMYAFLFDQLGMTYS